MPRTNTRKKKKQTSHKFLWALLVIVVLLIAGYTYRSTYYADHFLPNTQIEKTSVGQLTVAQADKKLQEQYSAATFTLTENNQDWKTINQLDLGLQTDFSADLAKVKKNQNQWLWGLSYLKGNEKHSLSNVAFDEKTLKATTDKLQKELETLNKDRTATKNATIKKADDGFEIVPEKQGDTLDTKKIIEALQTSLLAGKDSLELNDFEQVPTVTANDEKLTKELTELNKLAQVNGSYTINGETFQIPTESITSWLVYKDGKATLDRDQVLAYVTSLGEQYNTSTNSSSFESTNRGTVEVPAGTLSWTIATEDETDALMDSILAGEDFTRSPISQGSANSGDPLFGNTYIEVDLDAQHMWYYKDGSVVMDTDIVSGKPSTPTPPGVFYVWNKERNATLRGTNDDGKKYATPVDYWMPIDWTGVGLHDSPWQPAYGGNRWETAGSHGCVNTPPDVIAKLYDQVEVGTPVIIF